MYPRIKSVKTADPLLLHIVFDDGKRVRYDMQEDLTLPGYSALRDQPGLFESVQVDESRTVLYWSDEIDLPSDTLLEYGSPE